MLTVIITWVNWANAYCIFDYHYHFEPRIVLRMFDVHYTA